MSGLPLSPDPAMIAEHLDLVANRIGVRVAGSEAEHGAGQYFAQQIHRFGAIPDLETFPVMRRQVEAEKVEIEIDGQWREFACSLLGASPAVGAEPLTAPLVFFYPEVDYQRESLDFLRGKAVVHVGCHIQNRENYRRLMAARPAFLIFTDIRYPGVTPTADGLFPVYVRDIGAVPAVCAAYFDVWSWMKNGGAAARLTVIGEPTPQNSLNIIGEVPGSDPAAGIIFTGSHLDSQADTPGADDNASGMAFQLELARVLAPVKLKRTVRHIAFGAEEQLSVGSAAYVRAHRAEIEHRGCFMFNADSCGSLLGWTAVNFNGSPEIRTLLDAELHRVDLYAKYTNQVIPFTDQFPFAVCGVPGLWLERCNCAAGIWYHHRPENTVEVISPEVLARYVEAAANFIIKIGNAEELPFERRIPAAEQPAIQKCWCDLFGGW